MNQEAPPPRFVCRNSDEYYDLELWVNEELDRWHAEEIRNFGYGPIQDPEKYKIYAIQQANEGNIYPLRHLHPEYARFLFPPELARGKKFPKSYYDPMDEAEKEVVLIQALFKRTFGDVRRRNGEGPSAVEIAAERWDVNPEVLAARVKKYRVKRSRGK